MESVIEKVAAYSMLEPVDDEEAASALTSTDLRAALSVRKPKRPVQAVEATDDPSDDGRTGTS